MTVAFISGLCCNIWQNSCKSNRVQIVTRLDTVVVLKATIDTLNVERIKTKTIYEKQIDTIYLLDSVAIDSAYTKAIQHLQQLEGSGFFKH
jgi:hypothetical protein